MGTMNIGHEEGRGFGRSLQGIVVSNKMSKTITVEVVRTISHSKYSKFIKRNSKYHAHDEQGEVGVGDTVVIIESRPYSKTKKWRLKEIVQKAAL